MRISTTSGGVLVAALLSVALGGCPEATAPGPRAGGLEPLAAAPPPAAPPTAAPGLRIAISAAFVSGKAGEAVYEEITQHLAGQVGIACEPISGLSYETIDAMIQEGTVDLAFVCGLPYVQIARKSAPYVRLLVAPVMKAARYGGVPKYYSDVIVRADAPWQTFSDLRGCTFVFNEEGSNSGYNMPRQRLIELGETKGFFGRVLRSGSHEQSIQMVANGQADASAVDSLILDYELAQGQPAAARVRVIERLGPAGIPPVVASTRMAPELFERVQRAFLGMGDTPAGRAILDRALLERFVVVEDENYDDIRAMERAATDAGFMSVH